MYSVKTKNGLRVRPSYDQLMNAIIEDDIIRPKKPINVFDANWLMSTHAMTQLRKDALLDVQNLEMQMQKQKLLDMKAKEISTQTGKDIREAREEVKPKNDQTKYYDISDGHKTNKVMDDAYYEMELEEEERKRKETEKTSDAIKKVKGSLDGTFQNTLAYWIARSDQAPMEIEEKSKNRPGRPKISKGVVKEPITKKTSKRNTKKVEESLVSNPMIVNDEETQQKRKTEETPKIKVSKKIKKDTTIVKQENKAEPKSKGRRKSAVADDDVQLGNVMLDKTSKPEDMSAKEMKNQLNLRFPDSVGDWAFKSRKELIKIIKDTQAVGTW